MTVSEKNGLILYMSMRFSAVILSLVASVARHMQYKNIMIRMNYAILNMEKEKIL